MENVLVTGVNGTIAQSLVPQLVTSKKYAVRGLDIENTDSKLQRSLKSFVRASILQKSVLVSYISKQKITSIFHFAGILPMDSEKYPEKTQVINSGGTATVIEAAKEVAVKEKRIIKIIFPSSIAVYGLPTAEDKAEENKLTEDRFLNPITMYGITKLYSEKLGIYYSSNYPNQIDFRCVRIPGIISSITPEIKGVETLNIIHAASDGNGLELYVNESVKLPFVTMPDVVKTLIQLNEVDRKMLKKNVYNISAFSLKIKELAQNINSTFKDSSISYSPDAVKQKIVDSWPQDLDTTSAENDWSWKPEYNIEKTFSEYLTTETKSPTEPKIPTVKR